MKRSISILLIVTMLLSMFVIAMPASATGAGSLIGDIVGGGSGNVTIVTTPVNGSAITGNTANITGAGTIGGLNISATAPTIGTGATVNLTAPNPTITGANASAITGVDTSKITGGTGNTVVTKGDATRAAQLKAEGYIPIVQTIDENSPEGAVTFDKVARYQKYYLASDLKNPFAGIDAESTVIDGNGHTITLENGSPLFNKSGAVTLKNVTVTGTMLFTNNCHNSILDKWDSWGVKTIENVTINVNVDINNSNDGQRWGGLSENSHANSVIKNVLVSGTVTLKSGTTRYGNIGGLISTADGTKFINVTNNTNIVIEQGAVFTGNVGGIAGRVSGTCSFENCINNGTITFNGGPSAVGERGVGGIAGRLDSNDSITFKNCANNGAITMNVAAGYSIGGIAGFGQCKSTTFDNCYNSATADINYVSHYHSNPPIGVAGILGYQYKAGATKLEVKNCTNKGDITATGETKVTGGDNDGSGGSMASGIVAGLRGCQTVSFTNVINEGNVNNPYTKGYMSGNAGILAHWGSLDDSWMQKGYKDGTVSFTNVKNTGNVTANSYAAGIFSPGNQVEFGDAKSISFNNVINSGNVTSPSYASGIYPVVENRTFEIYFENVTNSGNVSSGGWGQGGIISLINGMSEKVVFSNCVNSGTVTATSTDVNLGGIVGYAGCSNITFENCKNTAALSVNYGGKHWEGFGGIAGSVSSGKKTFTNCVNEGALTLSQTATEGGMNVGGIVGYPEGELELNGCKNSGNITVNKSTTGISVGGLVGQLAGKLTVTNCANSGNVTVKSASTALRSIAGIAGVADGEAVFNGCLNTGNIELQAGSSIAANFFAGVAGILGSDGGNKLTFTNVINEGAISALSTGRNAAGIVASIQGDASFDNVKNTGEIKATSGAGVNLAAGGIIGFRYHESRQTDRHLAIKNATNTGAVSDTGSGGNGVALGGIAGAIRGAMHTELENCVNSGAINSGNATGGFTRVAGIVGLYGSIGNWIHNNAAGAYATFKKLSNSGEITSKARAAGIVGQMYELSKAEYITFEDCVNTNTITADGTWCAGGIIGCYDDSSIRLSFTRCQNSGDVVSKAQFVGGILPRLYGGSVSFTDCSNSGVLSTGGASQISVGGIAGFVDYNSSFNNCVNTGAISATNAGGNHESGIGGIVGYIQWRGKTNITNCKNEGDITLNGSGGFVNVGGIVGSNDTSGSGKVENCFNSGDILIKAAVKKTGNIGGVIGYNKQGVAVIHCINEGSITFEEGMNLLYDNGKGKDFYGEYAVGGVVGKAEGSNASMTNCQNSGAITLGSPAGRSIGGILGMSAALNVSIDNCYNTADGDISYVNHYGTNAPIGVGGIMGYQYRAQATSVTVKNVTNDGAIACTGNYYVENGTSPAVNGARGDGGSAVGGIFGAARGAKTILVENAINNGGITKDNESGWFRGVGGIMAFWGSCGASNWMMNDPAYNDATLTFKNVENNGDLNVRGYAAGIFAAIFEEMNDAKALVFENVTNTGDVSSTSYVGAVTTEIIGRPFSVSIKNVTNTGAISTTGTWTVGGLLANVTTQRGDNGVVIENCINSGSVSHSGATELGGIIGHINDADMTFKDCKNTADLTFSATVEGVNGDYGFGGIIGMANENNITYENLVNEGDLYVTNLKQTCHWAGVFVGGIIGYMRTANEIKNCVNSGSINIGAITGFETVTTGEGESATTSEVEVGVNLGDIGGIVGYATNTKIINSDNSGDIIFDDEAVIRYFYAPENQNGAGDGIVRGVAGIVGRGSAYSFTDCDNSGDIVSGGTVTGRTMAGIVGVSYANDLVVDNCTNTGDITFKGFHNNNPQIGVAGIVGHQYQPNANSISITNCENGGNIVNTQTDGSAVRGHGGVSLGGIAGSIRGIKNALVENCVNYGNLDNSVNAVFGSSCGGIVGLYGSIGNWMQGDSDPGCTFIVRDCANNGALRGRIFVSGMLGTTTEMGSATNDATKMVFDGCINTGDITTSGSEVGGILSAVTAACKVEFIDCMNSSDAVLIANGDLGKIGGIAGYVGADASFDGCVNYAAISTYTKGSGTEFAGLGGIAGYVHEGREVSFTDCENKGNLTLSENGTVTSIGGILGFSIRSKITIINCNNEGDIANEAKESSHYIGIGGICGFAYGYGIVSDDELAIIGCTNSGDVSLKVERNCGYGGIIGSVRAVSNVLIEGCQNTGNVSSARTSGGYATFGGGILGAYGTFGLGWDAKESAELNIINCMNGGSVSGYNNTAGILGSTMEIALANAEINIESCSNFGDVESIRDVAGGIMARTAEGVDGVTLNVKSCLNAGSVKSGSGDMGAHAAGILGNAQGRFTVVIDSCVNFGEIYANSWESSGIIGQINDDRCADFRFVKNCVNLGSITGSPDKPKAIGSVKQENCYALVSSCNNLSGATGLYMLDALDKAADLGVTVFYRDHLKDYIDIIDDFLDGILETKYDEFTLADLRAALAEAKRVYELADVEYVDADGITMPDFLMQLEIQTAYENLVTARENLLYADQKIELLDRTIAEAEELYASDAIYTAESWTVFTDALKAAKELRAKEDLAERDTDEIVNAIANIRSAIEALVLGGEIRSEADFALLNGQAGTFELMADITVSTPVSGFTGVLNGNGYTVTVNGCGLFTELDGVTVNDLTVNGDVGDAQSLFGKAIGNVAINNVDVEIEVIGTAALLDSADANAHITVNNVVSYASSEVAALIGNVGCRVSVDNVIVMGNAPALVGSVGNGSAITYAYVYGVEYYDAEGNKTTDTDVLASGKVAYEMNEKLGDTVLVQILGEDAAPKIGAAMADGLNVVIKVGDEYKNKGHKYDSGLGDLPEVPDVQPIAPYYGGLQAAIDRAEALNKDDYTAETWAILEAALAKAKAALESELQGEIDAASSALTIAAAGLQKKSGAAGDGAAVDYSKLDEVIAAAEALNGSDYTDGTWATLRAMLAMAKAAKRSTEQEAVDSAKAALQSAIANLAKAPVATDKPKDETPKPTEPATEDGCGSVVGGAAVILTAVIALGAGISFKKKED